MSVLHRISYLQERLDEGQDRELARELVEKNDLTGIKVIIESLSSENRRIQGDCIKVLYDAGSMKPEIIEDYVDDFLHLLLSNNNRLVWGSMMALSTIASKRADDIFPNLYLVYGAINEGSVTTVDNGVKVLAGVAAQNDEYCQSIFPFLIEHLRTCRAKEVPQHAESMMGCVNGWNVGDFEGVLREREDSLTPSQQARVRKLMRKLPV